MDYEAKIKQNIKDRRESLGVTRTEMARRLDISLYAYRKLESGDTRIFTKSFRNFAEQTDTSPIDLVNGYGTSDEKTGQLERTIQEMKERHLKETEELQKRIEDQDRQIRLLIQAAKDKDDVIESNKKLIRQYERRLEETGSEV
ncbi:MAG: hypothetical protein MJY84_00530 [Bacteroidales bacterium]|nr:hypothetical protein [Bacteroidales bacterium]